LPGSGAAALGEFADFVGDYGEAASMLSGAGGLDGGIQGEQVWSGRQCHG